MTVSTMTNSCETKGTLLHSGNVVTGHDLDDAGYTNRCVVIQFDNDEDFDKAVESYE